MRLLGVFALVITMLSGCGGVERPATVPVTGAVLLDGQPVEGASVAFWGPEASRAATGVTDSEGKFTLSMYDVNDGALAGENVVTVSKNETAAPADASTDILSDPTAMTSAYTESMAEAAKDDANALPAQYQDRNSTPLKVTVADTDEGRNHILQLTK